MLFTNEEMTILNSAAEILAKYVNEGQIKSEVFNLYYSMLNSSIEENSIPLPPGRKTSITTLSSGSLPSPSATWKRRDPSISRSGTMITR